MFKREIRVKFRIKGLVNMISLCRVTLDKVTLFKYSLCPESEILDEGLGASGDVTPSHGSIAKN